MAAVSHRRPCPLLPLLVLCTKQTTGGRDASHKVLVPSAFGGRVACCSGAASLRIIPLRHSASWLTGVSTARHTALPLRSSAWRKPSCRIRCTPVTLGRLAPPGAGHASSHTSQRDVPLPALGNFSRPCRETPGGAPGVRPFAVLTRPMRVGAFPPVSPTCRFLADPLRRYRSEDRSPWKVAHDDEAVDQGSATAASGYHPQRPVHPRQHNRCPRTRLPWALPLAGFQPPCWCVEAVSNSAPAVGPRSEASIAATAFTGARC